MIKKLKLFSHEECFDDSLPKYYDYKVDFEEYGVFKLIEFFPLYKLIDKLKQENLQIILEDTNASKDSPFKVAKGLALYYKEIELSCNSKIIAIISSGETQPGRYQIFKEGVWEIS